MSSIFKLSLSGVRAFDNHDREMIQFSKPLTLIAGPNGVGKTTIIEALRYASTGDLPPNSKGGAFVHDPKMSGEHEVLAQVKLAYYNTNGDQMVCTRSMQLTVKRSTQSFKTLEGQLLIMSNGKRETVSSRVADLDAQVPASLGVSPAILNYVTFCHQEDSLWPLSEPSMVKKRFDDIFEATKFTKALDTLKTLGKEYVQDSKVQEKSVQYLKQDTERAQQQLARANSLRDTIVSYTDECGQLKSKAEAAVQQLNDLFEHNQKFQQVIYELRQARKTREGLEISISELVKGLDVLDVNEEELITRLASFEENLRSLDGEIQSAEECLQTRERQLRDSQEALSNLTVQKSMIQNQKEAYDKSRQDLSELMTSWSEQFNLQFTESENQEHVSKVMQDRARSLDANHESERMAWLEQENMLQQAINTAVASKLRREHGIHGAKETIHQRTQEVEKLRSESRQAELRLGEAGNVAYQKSKLAQIQADLEHSQKELADFEAAQEQHAAEQRVHLLQADIEKGNADLTRAASLLEESSRLTVLRDTHLKKSLRLKTLVEQVTRRFQQSFGVHLDVHNGEMAIQEQLTRLSEEQRVRTLNATSARARKADLATRVNVAKQTLADISSNKDALKAEIEEALPPGSTIESFETLASEVEEDLNIAMQNMEQTSFTSQYYKAAEASAQKEHNCLLCHRNFVQSELQPFLVLLADRLASLPLTVEDATAALNEAILESSKIRGLQNKVLNYKALKTDEDALAASQVRVLEEELETASDDVLVAETELADADKKLIKLQSEEEVIQELRRLRVELDELQHEITEAEKSSGGTNASVLTPHKIQERLRATTIELRGAEQVSKDLATRLQTLKDRVAALNQKFAAKQIEIKNLELQTQTMHSTNSRIVELETDIAAHKGVLEELSAELKSCELDVGGAEATMKEAKIAAAKVDKESADVRNALHRAQQKHEDLWQILRQYEQNGSSEILEGVLSSINDHHQKVEIQRSNIAAARAGLEELQSRKIDARGRERTLQDNLKLRSSERELQDLNSRIVELETHEAERDREKYEAETNRLQTLAADYNSEYSSKLGEVKQMKEQVAVLDHALDTEYKNVAEEYRHAAAKLDSTLVATADIGTYGRALDAAIMQYHQLKMAEVNKVLDELWKKTYTGTDIDTILIKSEGESKGSRSSYNYRVCMVKQDTELDMRGRCSAGQKVLASVIIRLALSECFGSNSGLIVLDEPTTNLDHSNIESLAKSLSNIIDMRRIQKNFQLIIITHDEHFLSSMNAANFTDHFYRINRDSRQMSRIEKIPVGQLIV